MREMVPRGPGPTRQWAPGAALPRGFRLTQYSDAREEGLDLAMCQRGSAIAEWKSVALDIDSPPE